MPRYAWDSVTGQLVKISDRIPVRSFSYVEKPLCEQVREGYRRVEAKGNTVHGLKEGIKRIWSI